MKVTDRNEILRPIQRMAWQRAKGEMLSMLEVYYSEYDSEGKQIDSGYERTKAAIETAIKDIESQIY